MGKKNKKKKRDAPSASFKQKPNSQDKRDTESSVSESNTNANSSSDIDVSSEPIVSDREIKSSDCGGSSKFQQIRLSKSSRNNDESEVIENEMKDISQVNQETKQQYNVESKDNDQDKFEKPNIGKSSNNHSRGYSRECRRKSEEDYTYTKESSSGRRGHGQEIKKGYNSPENSNQSFVSPGSSGDKNKTNRRNRGNDESKPRPRSKTPDQKRGKSKANRGENSDSVSSRNSSDNSNKLRNKSNDRSDPNYNTYESKPISRNKTLDQDHVKVKPDENSDWGLWNSYKFRNKSNERNAWSRNKILDQEYNKFEDIYMPHREGIDMDYKVVQEIEGDLFTASTEYSLGHCVAEDMNMGSGIAVLFRREFKRVDELLGQRRTQGNVAILEDKERFIYYLVTKRISSGKPTYYTLWSSLQKMKDHIITNNVKKLALPRIGCGLDSLEWKSVKNMLEYIFQNVDIEIVIYNFQQESSSIPQGRLRKCNVVNTQKLLSEIEYGTIMVYFGSEDGYETEEIKDLCRKFPYIQNDYKRTSRVIGEHVYTERHRDGYVFYGCIVRKKHKDLFGFTDLQKCLKSIQSRNRKDKYEFIAFQAFLENGSPEIVSKIVNLVRHAMTNVDVYVCWPDHLSKYMPPR